MQIGEMAQTCGWKLLAGEKGTGNEVDGCYVGDLLSWVMARAQAGNVWLTVMGNVNAVAVATPDGSFSKCADGERCFGRRGGGQSRTAGDPRLYLRREYI